MAIQICIQIVLMIIMLKAVAMTQNNVNNNAIDENNCRSVRQPKLLEILKALELFVSFERISVNLTAKYVNVVFSAFSAKSYYSLYKMGVL